MSRERGHGKSSSGSPAAGDLPFSRPFSVEELLRRPDEPVEISADEDERKALAGADGLPGIASLEAKFMVARQGREIRVTGEVRAVVTQECVVTLDMFDSEIVEPVDVRFATAAPAPAAPAAAAGRMSRRRAEQAREERRAQAQPAPSFPANEEDDPPDPIVDGRIDLGALAAEFMALGLDPYPRKPGVEFAPAVEEDSAPESPFAKLARLKKDG